MPEEIHITAEPSADTTRCRFTVNRRVADVSYCFTSPEQAAGSPLAERILAHADVRSVLVHEDTVTVTVNTTYYPNWRPLAVEVGSILRAVLQEGTAPLAADLADSLPAEDDIRDRVQAVLDEQINPAVASHGGAIELLDVRRNVVYLRMSGGCQGCASAEATLRQGVESALREAVPALGAILDTTDHASGTNPYYAGR